MFVLYFQTLLSMGINIVVNDDIKNFVEIIPKVRLFATGKHFQYFESLNREFEPFLNRYRLSNYLSIDKEVNRETHSFILKVFQLTETLTIVFIIHLKINCK